MIWRILDVTIIDASRWMKRKWLYRRLQEFKENCEDLGFNPLEILAGLNPRDYEEDNSLPEGFTLGADGTYKGIPSSYMRKANQILGCLTGNREWDVPMVAGLLHQTHLEGVLDAATQSSPDE
jgi:hypothetical protein